MDAVIIYHGHKQYGKKHTMYGKIKTALKQMETDGKVSEEQQSVLEEIQRVDNYGWTIINNKHSYTDGFCNHPRVHMEGMTIVVKKPILQIARKLFAVVSLLDPDCLGEG